MRVTTQRQAYLSTGNKLRAPVVPFFDTLEAGGLEALDGLGNSMVGCGWTVSKRVGEMVLGGEGGGGA